MRPLLIAGDEHGNHQATINACRQHRPGTLILVGDMLLAKPFREVYAEPLALNWTIVYVLGNHDVHTPEMFHHLTDHTQHLDIGGKVFDHDGIKIGGIGGVFKKKNWDGVSDPRFRSRQDCLRQTRRGDRFENGIPLRMIDCVWYED